MKNKNTIISILLSSLLMICVSCSDELDLSPISSYNADSFYATQSDFELALNGAYDELQDLYSYSEISFCEEGRSDNVLTETNYDAGILSRFTDDETTDALEAIWQGFWKLIDRCNAILDQIDNGSFDDAAYQNYYKGDALFLRGFAYFQLGWMYGGVPLIDHQMTSDEIKVTARSSQDETLAFAATDLNSAASLLPSTWPSSSELGKATKYAAEGILARLYMFQSNFSSAKTLLSDIIISGNYTMATDYSYCFLDAYDNSPEHVFQIQFASGDNGEGNVLPVVCAPEYIVSNMFPQGGGSPYLHVSHDLYDSYASNDIRRDFTIQLGYTDKSGIVDNVSCFYIKYNHGTIPSTKDDYEVNLPILRYTDVKMMYAECLNEEGYSSTGDAFTVLNSVRSRAGLDAYTATDLSDQDSYRNAIFQERRWEFACEWLRWFDLIRSGNAQTVMNTFLERSENGNGTYSMQDFQKIFAIPQYELDINGDTNYMWQNPGY